MANLFYSLLLSLLSFEKIKGFEPVICNVEVVYFLEVRQIPYNLFINLKQERNKS
ncbi:hypothetical protein LEP1GSC074_2894 [Leptospira noguchii str. Hook]|nr:hypothetical protein LEP1GSC074_2894 [Leptospira noguchii str. Hook]